jgi:hypothetical protein
MNSASATRSVIRPIPVGRPASWPDSERHIFRGTRRGGKAIAHRINVDGSELDITGICGCSLP